jgi:hypothetical protein
MKMAKEYTGEEVLAILKEWGGVDGSSEADVWLWETTRKMNEWLLRGDGIAVYENQDLGHSEVGEKKFVSFGSPAAQLEVATPPDQLPDTTKSINWRYVLIGTYKGAVLSS